MIISDILEWNARRYPNKTALIYKDTRITFAQLHNRTNSLVQGLWDMGVKKGDRVAILADTCHQYAELILAIPKGGMIGVPVNYRFTPRELAYVVNDSGAETLFVDDNFKSAYDAMRPDLKSIKNTIAIGEPSPGTRSYDELISSYPSNKPEVEVEVDEDDIAYLIYTSGTTALPKEVMRSHKSIVAAAVGTIITEGLTPKDTCLIVLPCFHVGFVWAVITYAYIGCTTVVMRWMAKECLEVCEREKVTFLNFVPSLIREWVELPDIEKHDFSHLRRLTYGGAPCPEDLIRRAISIFGNKFDQVYALTEFGPPVTYLPAEDLDIEGSKGKRLLSCGKEAVNIEVRVVDKNGKDVEPGQAGEIIVKGDAMMSGYWHLPEKTAEAIKGGYYYTGDIAKIDEDGYIYIVDRKHDMIITGGENIYSPEVEGVLSSHPAVLEAAVIGVPDERWGEAIKALITLRPGMTATEEEIINFCRPRMAGYKRPKTVEFYEDFPRSALGKVSKKDLREKYWA